MQVGGRVRGLCLCVHVFVCEEAAVCSVFTRCHKLSLLIQTATTVYAGLAALANVQKTLTSLDISGCQLVSQEGVSSLSHLTALKV